MSLIARYLAREVLIASAFVLVALLALFAFFDVIREIGNLGRNDYRLAQALVVVALGVPGHLYEIVPIAALIGTLFALSRLVGQSEYAVMRVSGLSNWRIAGFFTGIGLVIAVATWLLGEFVSPWSEQAAQRYKLTATQSVVAQQFRSGLWVKDGNSFVNVREVLPDNTLREIEIYSFDDSGRLVWIRAAESGEWRGSQTWRLREVTETRFGNDGLNAFFSASQDWQSVLSPEILAILLIAPEKMSVRTLWRYVGHLKENGQQATRYEIALWAKFLNPLVIPVMMIVALPFAVHQPRRSGASVKLFLGILAGLAFHLMGRLFSHLGLLNDWPAGVVASLPLLIFLAFALAGVRWVDRR